MGSCSAAIGILSAIAVVGIAATVVLAGLVVLVVYRGREKKLSGGARDYEHPLAVPGEVVQEVGPDTVQLRRPAATAAAAAAPQDTCFSNTNTKAENDASLQTPEERKEDVTFIFDDSIGKTDLSPRGSFDNTTRSIFRTQSPRSETPTSGIGARKRSRISIASITSNLSRQFARKSVDYGDPPQQDMVKLMSAVKEKTEDSVSVGTSSSEGAGEHTQAADMEAGAQDSAPS